MDHQITFEMKRFGVNIICLTLCEKYTEVFGPYKNTLLIEKMSQPDLSDERRRLNDIGTTACYYFVNECYGLDENIFVFTLQFTKTNVVS